MRVGRAGFATIAAGLLTVVSAVSPALAQDSKKLSIELNNASDTNGGCRLTYVAVNGTGVALDKTSYEIVVFDADQKVSQLLILEFGKLPVGKTKVVSFDLGGHGCNTISRILINSASECVSGGQAVPVCLDELQTNTRTKIAFGQ
jgi:hypothetical protein